MKRKVNIPSVNKMAKNLIDAWNNTTRSQRFDGMVWYDEAHLLARTVSLSTGSKLSIDQVAGVIAVTSPMQSWKAQRLFIPLLVNAWMRGLGYTEVEFGIKSNLAKAWRIMNENDYTAISGKKVNNFWRGIIGDCSACTIDRWAIRAATNNRKIDVVPEKSYDAIADAYRRAANNAGIPVRDFQAAIWVWARQTDCGISPVLDLDFGTEEV